ncbi:MAG TPA: hypothetical protein VHS31_08560 [Tepidisphaeraceae bacterium]|nr:hypothetical protein [Tepidisphaeraceae bacterium]
MSNLEDNPPLSKLPSIHWKEMIAAAAVLGVLMAAQIVVTHAKTLFHQTAWLDEVHTLILVNDPDPSHFRQAMSNECVDANLPVYNQLLRWLHIRSPEAIRSLSLASTWIALLGIYYLLRGSFHSLESAAGVLTVWATPLIVYHAFQARFYAPWLASVVCFIASLQWERSSGHRPIKQFAIALTSILACTLHMLGLPAVALIVLADLIFNSKPIRSRLLSLLPALAGPIAVLIFLPLLREQRHSFAIATWLVGNPIRLLYSTFADLLPGLPCAVLILGLWATAWLARRRPTPRDNREVPLSLIAGLSVLILFPFVLLVISLLTQPVLLARYAIVSAAALAPAAAYATSRMHRSIAILLCLILPLETGAELVRRVREANGYRDEVTSLIATIDAQPTIPALFESRHQLFPVTWADRDLVNRCFYVDFQPGPNQLDPIVEGSERDVAKKFERIFGWPHVMPWETVISLPRFILISLDDDVDRIGKRFAGYSIKRIGHQQYELSR